jgi:hypothetical protein
MLLSGCSGPQSRTNVTQDVVFRQLIQPAFANDFANKRVKFDAVFYGLMDMTMDLPSEYQSYIRLQLCSAWGTTKLGDTVVPNCEDMYCDVVVAKDKSGPVFVLKSGQKVKIIAYAEPSVTTSAISGRNESKLLLVVDSLEPISQ